MPQSLGLNPVVRRLAEDLALPMDGDALAALRAHALRRVHTIAARLPVTSLADLQLLVANKLGVCLEFIDQDEDVARIGHARAGFSRELPRIVRAEFLGGATEGLLLVHPSPLPGELCYLAIIDRRGERAVRSYFTVWHELAHLLLLPPQLVFEGFRRSPNAELRQKDVLERVVDDVAGLVGFYEPVFGPALDAARTAVDGEGGLLSLAAIDAARRSIAPAASFYATAIAAVRRSRDPMGILCARFGWKPTERRRAKETGEASPQALRLTEVTLNAAARGLLHLHRYLRVPDQSVIARAHRDSGGAECGAFENQSWWETSESGSLAALSLRVQAQRRGPIVYALVHGVMSMGLEQD